jgi:hypothetical protein
MLFAHHLEPHHFPVLVSLFAAGFYVGWQALSRWLSRAPAARIEPVDDGPRR